MDLQLKGKTAFISGSTSGIGFACAKTLLKEGAKIIVNGRTQKSLDGAIDRLRKESPKGSISGLAADFSKIEEVETLLSQLPPIDILINNVGIFSSLSFFETTDANWHKHIEVNVMSGVRLSRHLMPGMLERNWGRIIFISSECAGLVPEDLIAYSMTKAALLPISRGLAQLTKGTEVTVNTVLPGSTFTEGAENFLQETAAKQNKTLKEVEEAFFSQVRTSSLLQRFATVDEVANSITYLASPLSVATNGSTLKLDGGSMGGIL